MADDRDDLSWLGAPNCPQCLEPMEAVVVAWWCASCEVVVRPGEA